jgi:protein associated with RNAse G/E
MTKEEYSSLINEEKNRYNKKLGEIIRRYFSENVKYNIGAIIKQEGVCIKVVIRSCYYSLNDPHFHPDIYYQGIEVDKAFRKKNNGVNHTFRTSRGIELVK